MPGLLSQIESAVGGLDLGQLAGGTASQYTRLGGTIAGWNAGAPAGFGGALGGVSGLQLPQLSVAGSLGDGLSGLLPALQGDLGGLVGQLGMDVQALPQRLEGDLLGALAPLLERIETLRTLLDGDWRCGLGGAAVPAPAPVPTPAPAPGPAPSPAPAPGALTATQVDAARAVLDQLPADLSVPSLMRWVHAGLGTVRPGYFTVRSLPLLDDLRDPLDTLIRWDDATAPGVAAELAATLAALTALIQAQANGRLAAALPGVAVSALPTVALGAAAEAYAVSLEALATAVQADNAAALPAALAAAQAALGPLLTQNAALAAPGASAARQALQADLAALPDALDAGLSRLQVLLQPRGTLADVIPTLDAPTLPPQALAPVTDAIDGLRAQLEAVLDAVDIGAVTGPLTEALSAAHDAVQAIEQGLAQLSAQALGAIGEARDTVQAIDLDALLSEAEQALEGATAQATQAVGAALAPAAQAFGDALGEVSDAIDGIDPEALAAPIREAITALGDVIQQEAVQRLVEVAGQLQELADWVATLSFEPVADEVIDLIGELQQILAGIDVASLPDPGPALIDGALSLLPPSLVPLTDPLIADLDRQVAGAPTALLEQVKTLPDEARARLLAFSPRQALQPLLSAPFQHAVGELDRFAPAQWLSAGDAALADLRRQLAAQIDIARLLSEPTRAFAAVVAQLDTLRPSTLLAPLETAVEGALQQVAVALPIDDVADALSGALARVTHFSATVQSALDVARHLSGKLAALGDPRAEFEDWLDQVVAKVPETPTGALATALTTLRSTALAAHGERLAADWAAARAPLAAALAQVDATARSTRLTLARSRIQAGLGRPAVGGVAGLADWFNAADTRRAADGLTALAPLARALAAADAALAAQFDALTARHGGDGPFGALIPADDAQLQAPLRDWVREALARQLGLPLIGLLSGLKPLTALLDTTVAALQALVDALDAKLAELLAAPQALADLLGSVAAVQQRLADLDLGVYTREVDTVYTALLDELRALDPRRLQAPLEAARDRLLGLLSLDALLPPTLRAELDAAHRALVAKLGSLDPDALLLEPLDAEYREVVEPLVAALDIGPPVQTLIDWLNALPEDLRAQIGRIDGPYGALLRSAPGGSGGGGSRSVSL